MGEPGKTTRGELAAGIAGAALIALTAGMAWWLAGPPQALPADAAAERFAAGRAMRDVVALAGRPRPIGSPAHGAAREFLLGRLTELGMAPEVQEATVVQRRGERRLRAARVRNLVGRRPGRGGAGAVLLVAHYDSRPNTPGAGDDASGVAVILEVVRALAAGRPLARDLIVLLSDAEELGLLGARAFVAEHRWLADVDVVLNFESRGSRGPAAMFETGRGDLDLVRALGEAAPHPLASSLSAEVYARMPNDTDFTAFRSAGSRGLNFAFIGGLAAYHTALDTPARLDPASLQHAGANAVALIRRLDGGGGDGRRAAGMWFNPLGSWLLVLPAAAAVPVAAALAALWLALALLGARRGRLGGRAVVSASLLAAGVVVGAPLAAALLWKLISDNAPGLFDTPHGLPHRLMLTGGSLFLAGLSAVAAAAGLARRLRPAEAALGVAAPLAILGLSCASALPGASLVFWWPLWGLLLAVAVVLAVDPPRPVAVLFVSAGALPGAVLLAPLAVLVFQGLTPHLAAAAMAPSALLLALGLPAVLAVAGQRQRLALAALVASLAVLAAAVWGGPDAQRPGMADVVHLEDLDDGAAWWLSRDERPHPWVVERLGGRPESWEAPSYLGFPERPVLRAEAPAARASGAGATGAEVVVVEDARGDGRRLTVRVRSPEGAPVLHVEAASTVQITAVEIDGERIEAGVEEAARPLRLLLAGFSAEGVQLSFELPDRWPVELHVSEQFYGLPGEPALPPELVPSTAWTSHSRLVHRSFLR